MLLSVTGRPCLRVHSAGCTATPLDGGKTASLNYCHYAGQEQTLDWEPGLNFTHMSVGDWIINQGILVIESRGSNIIWKFSGGGGTLSRGARSHKTCLIVRQVCCTPVFTGNARSPVAFPWPSPPGLDGRGLVTRRAPGGSGRRLH